MAIYQSLLLRFHMRSFKQYFKKIGFIDVALPQTFGVATTFCF
jgi:hypothetical protein